MALTDYALRVVDTLDQTGELAAFFQSLTDLVNAGTPATSGRKVLIVSATRGSDDPVDAHDGSDSAPYATIAYVIDNALVAAGDTVLIEPGTYVGYLVPTVPINLIALVPGTVTLTNAGGTAGAAAFVLGSAMTSGARKMLVVGCEIAGFNGNTNVTLGISGLVAGATGLAVDFIDCRFTAGVSGLGVVNILEATATCYLRFIRCVFGVGTLTIARCDTGATHDQPIEFQGCVGSLSLAVGSAGIWALKILDCTFRPGALTEVGTTAGWLKLANSEITLPAFWAGAVAETSDLAVVRVSNQLSTGYVYYTGNVTALDIVTIGTRVYEYTAGAGVSVPGRVEVAPGGAGPWAPAVAVPALIAAVNADASRVVDAVIDGSGVSAMLVGKDSTTASALSQVTATGGGVVSAATLIAGLARAPQLVARRTYTVTVADVTKLAVNAATHEIEIGTLEYPGATPVVQLDDIRTSAVDGASKAWATTQIRARRANTRDYAVTFCAPGGVLLAAADVILWSAWA